MHTLLASLTFDPDSLSLFCRAGWTIVEGARSRKRVLMHLKGNVTGQIRHIPAHTSVVMPDNSNYRFWDAETHMEIVPRRQVIVNRQGFFE